MQAAIKTYLKLVPFANLNLWDVKRYYDSFQHNFESVVTLSDILIPFKRPVSKQEMIINEWQIISKINFSGELFLRDFQEINTYKGNLSLVPENAIIYSKINVRHGCIYYHEKGKTPFGVSSEYPTYTFDETKVNGRFLHKLLRSASFKNLLNTKTTGISKARVKQDDFLSLQIPLPKIEEQQKIVEVYHSKLKEAESLRQQAEKMENEVEEYLFDRLGIKFFEKIISKSFLTLIDFKDVERWSVDFIQQNKYSAFIKNGKYQPARLRELITGYQYGLSEKASKQNIGLPMLRMNNIFDSELVTDDLKYIPDTTALSKFILDKGDLLFNRTNSKELVGKTAVFELDSKYTFASYLIRVKINDSIADVHYINYLFNSSILQFQKDLVSRQITGQANINAQEMQDFLFPLPPLSEQKGIANNIKARKEEIKRIEAKIKFLQMEAEQEFEKQIFN